MRGILRTVRRRVADALGAGETPERLAAAWALGVCIGLSPLLGLQTGLALLLAFAFRLNRADVLLGTLVNNPWTMPVYFPFAVVVGQHLTGVSVPRVALPELGALLDPAYWRQQWTWLEPLMFAWWAGGAVIAPVGGVATYSVVRALIARHRRRTAGGDGASGE